MSSSWLASGAISPSTDDARPDQRSQDGLAAPPPISNRAIAAGSFGGALEVPSRRNVPIFLGAARPGQAADVLEWHEPHLPLMAREVGRGSRSESPHLSLWRTEPGAAQVSGRVGGRSRERRRSAGAFADALEVDDPRLAA